MNCPQHIAIVRPGSGPTAVLAVDVAMDDALLDHAIEVIRSSARIGNRGDGKIIVRDIAEVIRIRTGETGKDAL